MEAPVGPLAGIKIADFSRILAGPFASMQLADLGAEVTKVERPGAGDDTRSWSPPADDRGEATYFQAVNRNKSSVAIELTSAAGLAEALELVDASDVLIENFRPGVMDRLGLGYDDVRERNPDLVYCSITGFGRGAGAMLPAYDLLLQAVGGLMSITGEPDRPPQKVGVALVDVLAGLYATVGIQAALRHREAGGGGQRVEVSLLEALLGSLANEASGFTLAGVVPERMGNAHPSIAPYDLYATAAGEICLAVGNDRQFAALCEVLGAPELATDERFRGNAERVGNRETLRAELERRLATAPAHEWAERLTAARVPAGTVNDIAAAFALAERIGLDPIVEIDREDGTAAALSRNPIRLSETPATYRLPPPSLPG